MTKSSGVVITGKKIRQIREGHTWGPYLNYSFLGEKKSEPNLAKQKHVEKLCVVSIQLFIVFYFVYMPETLYNFNYI